MATMNLFIEASRQEMARAKESFFEEIKKDENFVGHLYDLNYETTNVLVNDFKKSCQGRSARLFFDSHIHK